MTESDLRSTLNLPRTDFPMKANLPQAEPRRLARWQAEDLYGRIRAARKGRPSFVLHDGPPYANGHIHLGHRPQQDPEGRGRPQPVDVREGRPVPAGLGLPRAADRAEGGPGPRREEARDVAAGLPPGLPGLRREVRAHPARGVRAAGRPRRVGGPLPDDVALVPGDDRARSSPPSSRTGSSTRPRSPSTGASPAARRWPRPRSSTTRTTSARRSTCASRSPRPTATAWPRRTRRSRQAGLRRHLDDDPLDAARQPRPRRPPGRRVRLLPARGHGRRAARGEGPARGVRGPLAREGQPRGAPPALGAPLAEAKGAELERLRFRHPWIDRDSPVLLADYVTLDTGTGVVHTAPGHGWDDYLTGIRYGLDIYCPVDEAGRFLPEVEHFAGQKVFDANPAIVDFLRETRRAPPGREGHALLPALLALQAPVIFRATEQWFIALDDGRPTLREQALAAIAESTLDPRLGRGAHPQHDRDAARLVHLAPAPVGRADPGLLLQGRAGRSCCAPTSRATWPTSSRRRPRTPGTPARRRTCLPAGFACPKCGGTAFDKETDILDVWFDSGSSHAAALGHRADLPWPADLYLEGSDQHRGWFHSSLLIGVATRGRAPYRQVLTHGFIVDGEGKKISKSLGNDVDTQKLIHTYGAEVLRLWATMVDYREDMRISDDMIKRRGRGLPQGPQHVPLPALEPDDFDPARDAVADEALDELDRYALDRHRQVVAPRARRLRELRVPPRLPPARPVLRGRPLVLLPRRAEGPALLRRRGRSDGGARPRPCSTASRGTSASCWPPSCPSPPTRPGRRVPGLPEPSVHTALFPARETPDDALLARWAGLLDVRAEVTKALEEARAAKQVAASLEAAVVLRGRRRRSRRCGPTRRRAASSPATSRTSSS